MSALIVLAGGLGKRMGSHLPKPLIHLAGKPMVLHILQKAEKLGFEKVVIVVPSLFFEQYQQTLSHLSVTLVQQDQQDGTGAAVLLALPHCQHSEHVFIWYADMPLVRSSDVISILGQADDKSINLVTLIRPEPFGMGRIIRNNSSVTQIVEEKDASDRQKAISEVFSGMMRVPTKVLENLLPMCDRSNQQAEILLTDIVALANQQAINIKPIIAENPDYFIGINEPRQWSQAERLLQQSYVLDLQHQGAMIADPSRCDIRGDVTVGRGVFIDVGVILEGKVYLGDGVRVGAYSHLTDVHAEEGVVIKDHCVIENTQIEPAARIGPFAYCRVENKIGEKAKIGSFVELKKVTIGAFSKASHLTYLGDSEIGNYVNIGAGVITCNYDGKDKHQTTIESNAFIGAGVELIAPISIGYRSFVAAGSTVTDSVEPGALAIARVRQRSIANWTYRKKKAEYVD